MSTSRVKLQDELQPSSIARLTARLGNPLTWSAADRCIFAGVVILPFTLWFDAILRYYLRNPTAAPYIDREFLVWLLPREELFWIGGWLAIIALGLLFRRRAPESRLLVAATVNLFSVGTALFSYAIGHYTAGYLHAVTLAGAAVGLILFNARQMFVAIASFLVVIVITTLAEQRELIPYAPLLVGAPVEGHRLSTAWLLTIGMLSMTAALFGAGLTALIVALWRKRELQLAEASDQLARANELISRYIAQQVVEQIRLGNYEAIDRQFRRRLTLFFSDIKASPKSRTESSLKSSPSC